MRLARLTLPAIFAVALFAAPLAADAQEAGKVYRLGILGTVSPTWHLENWRPFREGLRELGYVEGRNLVVEYRSAEGRAERLPALAIELVKLNVDVIYAPTTAGALAARNATTTIPIVFTLVNDPVGAGLVTSVARPGGNITGTTHLTQELIGKRLQLLKEILPNASRVAVLSNPGDASTAPHLVAETERAARSLAMKLQIVEARTPDAIEHAFAAAVSQRPAALLVDPHIMFWRQRSQIVGLAARHRLPAVYESRSFPEAGGLMSFGASSDEESRRDAALVDKVLKGAKPADLPIEGPTKFELVINLIWKDRRQAVA